VLLMNYGARIVSVKRPNALGEVGEITLGYDALDEYVDTEMNYGATIGRVVNRIAGGVFELDGIPIYLSKNREDLHHVHGGFSGFDKKVWAIQGLSKDGEGVKILFEYLSPDGDEGYPGNLDALVEYSITADTIEINYSATSDQTTIANLTNHAYWNLEGPAATVQDQELTIPASNVVATSDDLIPTGDLDPVEDSWLDFRAPKSLQDAIETRGGVDHNFVLDKGTSYGFAARVRSPSSGRAMTVETDQPICVCYTGNYLKGKSAWGNPCAKHQALCLETQQFPDAVHHPNFPSIVLRPGETYHHIAKYIFTIEEQGSST
jgi:aldose 1-epimerase